jgi:GTP pyrophosphokinase
VIGPYGERMEVQIRTVEMDMDAEYGIAAHWKYKQGHTDRQEDDRRFAWLRQLLEWQKELADPHEFLDTVKLDLFPDEVFVFTPRGEVMNLPRRSTPIDFAYAVHSEVGNQCAGAKVNGKMVPLRHVLVDGDTVEIFTSEHQYPRKDWLEFVASGKARNNIRHSIRVAQTRKSRELGRDILSKELRRAGLSLDKALAAGELEAVAQAEIRGGTAEDLFAWVSYGKLAPSTVVRRLKGEAEGEGPKEERPATVQGRIRNLFKRSTPDDDESQGVRVNGLPNTLVRFGGCCDPLPGDDIIGFVTRGRGVTVHSRSCARVFELDPERRIEVDWDADEALPRKVKIRVTSRDKPGILAKITNSISSAGINITAVKVSTDEAGRATQSFELVVSNSKLLEAVMKEISRVKGVLSVDRTRG